MKFFVGIAHAVRIKLPVGSGVMVGLAPLEAASGRGAIGAEVLRGSVRYASKAAMRSSVPPSLMKHRPPPVRLESFGADWAMTRGQIA